MWGVAQPMMVIGAHQSLFSSSFHTNSLEYLSTSRYLARGQTSLNLLAAGGPSQRVLSAVSQLAFPNDSHQLQWQGSCRGAQGQGFPPGCQDLCWAPQCLLLVFILHQKDGSEMHHCAALYRKDKQNAPHQRTRFLSMISCRISSEGPKWTWLSHRRLPALADLMGSSDCLIMGFASLHTQRCTQLWAQAGQQMLTNPNWT